MTCEDYLKTKRIDSKARKFTKYFDAKSTKIDSN